MSTELCLGPLHEFPKHTVLSSGDDIVIFSQTQDRDGEKEREREKRPLSLFSAVSVEY